jgi:mannose/fructose/N-acetylgalactosamine-specific phosphotransferase system component IID
MDHYLAKLLPYLGPLLIIALVAWRLIKNAPRKVKSNRLFVMPLVLALAMFFTLKQSPAPGVVWLLIFLAAALIGAGAGYLNGRHREFTLDAESGEIMSRATPVGTIIFAALFAARFGLKLAFPQLNAGQAYGPQATAVHPAVSVISWTEAGLVFSTAMIFATAFTTWFRTRHLAEQRRARSAPTQKPSERQP